MNKKIKKILAMVLIVVGALLALLIFNQIEVLIYHLKGLYKIIMGGYSGKLGYYLGGFSFFLITGLVSFFLVRIGSKLLNKLK